MGLESTLTAAAIIGLVVALLQLIIWACRLVHACGPYFETNQVVMWAVEVIGACYTRLRRPPYAEMQSDVEMANFETIRPSSSSTNLDYVDQTVLRTRQISKNVTAERDVPEPETLRLRTQEMPTDATIQATGVDTLVAQVFRKRLRRMRKAESCDRWYDSLRMVSFRTVKHKLIRVVRVQRRVCTDRVSPLRGLY